MPDFCCDVDVLSVSKLCDALLMFTAYEPNLRDLFFNILT